MLELTMGGRCVSGIDAVAFFEALPDSIPEEIKTEEFSCEYEFALNRVRYEIRKSIPKKPTIRRGKFTEYVCGQCGSGVKEGNNYCPKCGREIGWKLEEDWHGEIDLPQ